jgi:hypothetical protein
VAAILVSDGKQQPSAAQRQINFRRPFWPPNY